MIEEQAIHKSLEDRVHRAVTWWRVPLMAAAFVGVLGFIYNLRFFWYGVPVVMFGELIQIWATSHLHKDTRFTISGPYSHVRNPMYFGRFFVGLGIFIMTWSVSPFILFGYVALYGIYGHLRVRREERRLREIFSPHYQAYSREISRWVPSLKPYSGSERRRARWAQVCANHEHTVALGIIMILGIIYLRIILFPALIW